MTWMQSQSPRVSSVRERLLADRVLVDDPRVVGLHRVLEDQLPVAVRLERHLPGAAHPLEPVRRHPLRQVAEVSSSDGRVGGERQNTNPFHVSIRTGTRPFSTRSKPSASFMSGQPHS